MNSEDQEQPCKEDFALQRILNDQAVGLGIVVDRVSEHINYWHYEQRPPLFGAGFFRAVY